MPSVPRTPRQNIIARTAEMHITEEVEQPEIAESGE